MILDPQGFFGRVCKVLNAKNAPEIARKLGISKHAVYLWEKGNMPGVNHLRNVARAAEVGGVSLHWLLTGTGPESVQPGVEGERLNIKLASDEREALKVLARREGLSVQTVAEQALRKSLIESGTLREEATEVNVVFYGSSNLAPIRVVGEIENGEIRRYPAIQLEEVAQEFRPMEKDVFALRVRGDCLDESGINSGDLVVYQEQASAPSGSVVIARTPEGATVRTFYSWKGSITLRPRKKEKPDWTFQSDQVDILGVVVGLQRDRNASANRSNIRLVSGDPEERAKH